MKMKRYRIYHTEKKFREGSYRELSAYKIVEVLTTEAEVKAETSMETRIDEVASIHLISTRLRNLFVINGIRTVEDLSNKSYSDFHKLHGVGGKLLMELIELCERLEIKIKED